MVVGTFDLEAILSQVPAESILEPVPAYPPVLEDLAVVVAESTPAAQVERVIFDAGGELVADVRLFDLFRGEQIGQDKKSLAYSIVYQAKDRTLTDEEVADIRQKIIAALDAELGAQLRS